MVSNQYVLFNYISNYRCTFRTRDSISRLENQSGNRDFLIVQPNIIALLTLYPLLSRKLLLCPQTYFRMPVWRKAVQQKFWSPANFLTNLQNIASEKKVLWKEFIKADSCPFWSSKCMMWLKIEMCFISYYEGNAILFQYQLFLLDYFAIVCWFF